MEPELIFAELAQKFEGKAVLRARLFLRTLQIYLARGESKDERPFQLWCQDAWHIRNAREVITGSGALESPERFDDDEELARCDATADMVGGAARDALVGQTLKSMAFDPVTFELRVSFSDDFTLATFSADPDCDLLWVLYEPGSGIAARGTTRGLARGTRSAKGYI